LMSTTVASGQLNDQFNAQQRKQAE